MALADTPMSLDAITAWTAVTAIATVLLVVGAGAAAWFARGQLQSVTQTWREENRAYVIAEFAANGASQKWVDFVIRNVGRTPAFDVTITWDQRPEQSEVLADRPFAAARMFNEPIAMLTPGHEHRLLFDSHIDRHQRPDLPRSYRVTVGYSDRWGERHTHEYPLDFAAEEGRTFIDVKGVHDVAKSLETVAQTLMTSQTMQGPVRVVIKTRRAPTPEPEDDEGDASG